MSSYLLSWKPGPRAPVERSMVVWAANMIEAAELADRKIFYTYPNYQLTGLQLISPTLSPSIPLAPALSDAELERARAER